MNLIMIKQGKALGYDTVSSQLKLAVGFCVYSLASEPSLACVPRRRITSPIDIQTSLVDTGAVTIERPIGLLIDSSGRYADSRNSGNAVAVAGNAV